MTLLSSVDLWKEYSSKMRSVCWPIVAIALLTVGVAGCGGTGAHSGPASRVSSSSSTTTAPVVTPALRSFEGDEDDDDQETHTMGSFVHGDSDNDSDNDYLDNVHKGYYDSDDGDIFTYGHPASAADRRAIAALVERYYAAAAAERSAEACSLIYSVLAGALPEDYGRAPGPAYLRGANTCQMVMSRLLEHVHNHLTGAIEVIGVRVSGDEAQAQLGSRTIPASLILVRRERGVWKIDELLGSALP